MQLINTGEGVASTQPQILSTEWQLSRTPPDSIKSPDELNHSTLNWIDATVPGTVAQSLEAAEMWDIDSDINLDAEDWWYHCAFQPATNNTALKKVLHFSGLATLADVWLNGQHILSSENMFVTHTIDVTEWLSETNSLVICFRSLHKALSVKRPRPRWKTNLVNQQQLRWVRTTLLGRIPGWAPQVAPIGPWRSISLDTLPALSVEDIDIRTTLTEATGLVKFSAKLHHPDALTGLNASLSVADKSTTLSIEKNSNQYCLTGTLKIENVAQWWPHTHGEPTLHHGTLHISSPLGELTIDCGKFGFRQIEAHNMDANFSLRVNGKKLFYRGACWTINDITSLTGSDEGLEHHLKLAVEAGMNMLRIGGTMLYESDLFYQLCDKLGIMVWQDFMFANMDYPIEDAAFRSTVEHEVTQQLKRWQRHPCITLYCGNSEVEQQAAMLGMPKEIWRNRLFSSLIPELCNRWHHDIPYLPSSPSGKVLPFHVGSGISHYYSVGAYLKPLSDAKSAGVHFASECLGFSNVPEQSTINKAMGGLVAVTHHPKWKRGVPRDTGANWDFEDTREHYLEQLFSVDAAKLRSFDPQQYFDLSRVVTGEVMTGVFSEWRTERNPCQGGLVWFYKDLIPGAGWGIIDSEGVPKACYYALKRIWASQVIYLTDEGADGLLLHISNEKSQPLEGNVTLQMLVDGNITTTATKKVTIQSGSTLSISSDELLDGFYDAAYAYRFGPPKHDVVIATLSDEEGNIISEASLFPQPIAQKRSLKPIIHTTATAVDDAYLVKLESNLFLRSVHFEVTGYIPDDNYFCLLPGRKRVIRFRPYGKKTTRFRCYVEALNMKHSVKVTLK